MNNNYIVAEWVHSSYSAIATIPGKLCTYVVGAKVSVIVFNTCKLRTF